MERADNKGQEFFSVFYKSEPLYCLSSIVDFGADLKGSGLRKVQRWKDVLSLRDNGKFIAEIANKICQVPRIAKYPVGIKSRVEEVNSLLKVESGGVYFVGLWERGGVGKTTVAREIFDEISCLAFLMSGDL